MSRKKHTKQVCTTKNRTSRNISSSTKVSLWDLPLPSGLKSLTLSQCEGLTKEIRKILIDTVSKTGGHLASNLGSVELTLALHRIFSSPKDKIIWDVGHQAYTHKLLTGRLDSFSTLRQENGVSGFPRPSESIHDAFIAGHSSNSISAACGIARGMKLQGDEHHAIAIIGDGAFTGGLAYEGLNNAGKSEDNIIIILNHNDMSISKNVGAFAKYIAGIRANPEYLNTKQVVEKILNKTPFIGKPLKNAIKSSKSVVKGLIYHSTLFEDFGFVYLGPVDGHNLVELEKTLRTAKSLKKPVFVHVNTVKGKGFEPAEKNPGAFHAISKSDMLTGNPEIISEDSYSAVFGRELTRLADQDSRICAITAAMKYGTGLQFFYADHKERFFDVGIAEQHAVTFSAGLAQTGLLPVFAVYSSFLQRAYDQVLHDAAVENTHIVLAIDRAGLVGEDGETHQGIFDVPFLTSIPNVTIYSPSCYAEVRLCLSKALFQTEGVACVRYPRGADRSGFDKSNLNTTFSVTANGSKTLLITYGRLYDSLVKAQSTLSGSAVVCDILKLTQIFPLTDEVFSVAMHYDTIFFFEESSQSGGIAEHFSSALLTKGYVGGMHITAIHGFVKHGTVNSQLATRNMTPDTMSAYILQVLKNG